MTSQSNTAILRSSYSISFPVLLSVLFLPMPAMAVMTGSGVTEAHGKTRSVNFVVDEVWSQKHVFSVFSQQ